MENPVQLIPDIPVQLGADQPFLRGEHIMIFRFTWPCGIKKSDSTRMHINYYKRKDKKMKERSVAALTFSQSDWRIFLPAHAGQKNRAFRFKSSDLLMQILWAFHCNAPEDGRFPIGMDCSGRYRAPGIPLRGGNYLYITWIGKHI
jgi:hypothetical protein